MNFRYSGFGLEGRERKLQRFLEVLPGLLTWTILVGMTVLSFAMPLAAGIVIIAFDLYWMLKLLYMTVFLILAYMRLSAEKSTDWMAFAEGLSDIDGLLSRLSARGGAGGLGGKLSRAMRRKELAKAARLGVNMPRAADVYNLVIIPVAKEGREIIEPGIRSIASGAFPPSRIIVALAVEARASSEVKGGVRDLAKEYKGRFFDLLIFEHPDGLPGEARVKGANATFAAKGAKDHLEKRNIPLNNVIVSCFDCDTVVEPDYFSSMTYHFLISPDRTRASFQPVPVYNNNIWDSPGITRVLETGSSFFQLVEATNPEELVTFSSHSMSFKALVEIGYWPVDMISDDSAIFWKAYVHYDGKYRVVPVYVTISMDAVIAESWWKTVKCVYKQRRRWAWGVESFPIITRAFLKKSDIPVLERVKCAVRMLKSHVGWAVWPFLLAVVGWLPALFAGREFSQTVLYYSAPRITRIIFNLAGIALLTSIILSLLLLPKPPKAKHSFLIRIGYALEWLLVPLTVIALSAIPAADAQTRLMFGRYMTFWVTDKTRNGKCGEKCRNNGGDVIK